MKKCISSNNILCVATHQLRNAAVAEEGEGTGFYLGRTQSLPSRRKVSAKQRHRTTPDSESSADRGSILLWIGATSSCSARAALASCTCAKKQKRTYWVLPKHRFIFEMSSIEKQLWLQHDNNILSWHRNIVISKTWLKFIKKRLNRLFSVMLQRSGTDNAASLITSCALYLAGGCGDGSLLSRHSALADASEALS